MIPRHDSSHADGIGDRVLMKVEKIKTKFAQGETLKVKIHLTEDGQPVTGYPGDPTKYLEEEIIPNGQAQAWLFIIGPLDEDYGVLEPNEQRLVMSIDGTGTFSRDWKFDKTGRFRIQVVAVGHMRDGVPKIAGYPYSRMFETTVAVGQPVSVRTDAWCITWLEHAGNRHFKAGLERLDQQLVVASAKGLIMAPVLRQPMNFMVPRERVGLDGSDGSIYCGHVANPQLPKHSIMHIKANGEHRQLPPLEGVDVSNLVTLAVDGPRRRIWLGLPNQLIAVDLNSKKPVRTVDDVAIQAAAIDSTSGGVWTFARKKVSPGGNPFVLHRFGIKEDADLEVNTVRGSLRNFLHPLNSGGIICNALYKQNHVLVRVNRKGEVEKSGFPFHSPTKRRVVEMSVNPSTNEPWIIHVEGGRTVLSYLDADFNILITYGPLQLNLHTIWSVDVNPQSGDTWICGHQMVENSDPSGPDYIPERSIQRRDSSGIWHSLSSTLNQSQGLIRTFK